MLQYLDPGADTAPNFLATQKTGEQPTLPETSAAQDSGTLAPRQERVRHLLYGSLAGLDRTIKILHTLGYADPNDWSEPMPVPQGGAGATGKPSQWMVIMTKILLME